MNDSQLTYKKIFLFWIPLAATWLMMSVEGPLIAAVIARMVDAKFNLAAYGVAYSFALVVEAPIIMIMSAATALVKDRNSYYKLRNFTYFLNASLTLIILCLLIPDIFDLVTQKLIGLPKNVSELTYKAVLILTPWPASIGYRRFFHGILIKNNLTKRVALTTVTRVIVMATTALLLFGFSDFDGVIVGASALSAGVIMEALMSKLLALKVVTKIKLIKGDKRLDYFYIARFYYPLALTALLSLGVHPVVTFFLGKSIMAIESLAVLPVINSLVFIFRSFGLSYQEVVIALIGDKMEGYKTLRNFAVAIGGVVVGTLIIIAYSPLAMFWFKDVSGLSNELASFAILPLKIFAPIAALTFFISFERASLVFARITKPITFATAIEVAGIIVALFILTNLFQFAGAVAAAASYIIGRVGSVSYLFLPFIKSIKRASRLEI